MFVTLHGDNEAYLYKILLEFELITLCPLLCNTGKLIANYLSFINSLPIIDKPNI